MIYVSNNTFIYGLSIAAYLDFIYYYTIVRFPGKRRWIYDVMMDIKYLKVRNWKTKVKDRAVWKNLVR